MRYFQAYDKHDMIVGGAANVYTPSSQDDLEKAISERRDLGTDKEQKEKDTEHASGNEHDDDQQQQHHHHNVFKDALHRTLSAVSEWREPEQEAEKH